MVDVDSEAVLEAPVGSCSLAVEELALPSLRLLVEAGAEVVNLSVGV